MPHNVCAYFTGGLCRSCTLLGLSPEERCARIHAAIEVGVIDIFGAAPPIEPLWSPEQIFPSRVKMKFSVAGDVELPSVGFTKSDGSLVELLDCPLHEPRLNTLLHFLCTEVIPRFGLVPYNITTRCGEFKGVMLLSNHDHSEVILRFILRSRECIERIRKALPLLADHFPEVCVVSCNIQPIHAAIPEGLEEEILTEKGVIGEHYPSCGLVFAPQSFVQVTYASAAALYQAAADLVLPLGVRHALDLYCGVGGFLFSVAPSIQSGIGVEVSEKAIECALFSRKANKASHLSFQAGQVEKFLESYCMPAPDLIIINPPRRGLSEKIVQRILALGPSYVLYSSCNMQSLFVDLRRLSVDYRVEVIKPFDMFPLTEHVEILTMLRKN